MSVVSSVEAVPNRLAILARDVAQHPEGLSRAEVLRRVVPSGEGELAPKCLVEALRIGLLKVDGDIHRAIPEAASEDAILAYLDGVLRQRQPARERQHEEVTLALAWLLTLDPLHPLPWGRNPVDDVRRECAGRDLGLTNASALQQFLYWARYLGYATFIQRSGAREAVADPTRALRRLLPGVFEGSTRLPVRELFRRLGGVSDLFEDGAARSDIEDCLAVAPEVAPERLREPGAISRSTGLALRRLHRSGELRLEEAADADKLVMLFPCDFGAVSHISLGEVRR